MTQPLSPLPIPPPRPRVDWRRPSNLNAAFAASAAAAGLESAPLFDTFQYEVDLTHGGVFGGGGKLDSSARRQKIDGDIENVGWRKLEESGEGYGDASAHAAESQERYSSTALSYVNPVLAVSWPLGVLLPAGALRSYGSIHRALFRHQIALHRLRRLRLTLRALDVAMTSLKRAVVGSRRRAMDLSGTGGGGVREAGKMTMASWDCGRLHWVHLFRHEMQHMADSLQVREVESIPEPTVYVVCVLFFGVEFRFALCPKFSRVQNCCVF